MDFPRTRRVQRVHLAQPIVARLGSARVLLVDLSVLGARVEHHVPIAAGGNVSLTFEAEGEPVVLAVRIVRSRLERFSVGAEGLTVYHSGLEFQNPSPEVRERVKKLIGTLITQALEEQKLNARGVTPQHEVGKMPIFRLGGQLTSNAKDREVSAPAMSPAARLARETGYVCYQFAHDRWQQKRTHDPGQPEDGFTISASEDHGQAQLLCEAYQRSDADGRRMIQLFAQMSIVEGEGASLPPPEGDGMALE